MGNKPMAAGFAGGVADNDVETLAKFFDQIPEEQKERIKAVLGTMQVQVPSMPSSSSSRTVATDDDPNAQIDLTEEQMANIRQAFDAIDSNGNGTIEAKEFMMVMQALDISMTDAECEAIFDSCDLNKDKKIQFEEYVSLIKEGMRIK
mmetsp:Transcript_59250/g.94010  ORF Transcript_59250/g.94010 Transcript_59250/m.94010 type:complete len:148 (-) Transcript_59250:176-619(-)